MGGRTARLSVTWSIFLSFGLAAAGLGLLPVFPTTVSAAAPEHSSTDSTSASSNPSGSNSSSTSTAPARKLAHQVVEAYGGMAKIKEIDALPSIGTGKYEEISMISGASTDFECKVITREKKFRMEMDLMGQPMITGFDGHAAWIKQAEEVLPCDSETTRELQEEIEHGLIVLEQLENPDTELKLGKSRMIGGKECQALIVKSPSLAATTLFVNPDTNLIVRSDYEGTDIEQGVRTLKSVEYSDYRQICGMPVPFHTVEYNDGKKSGTMTLLSVKVDRTIADDIFKMPPESVPERLKAGAVTLPFQFIANEIMVSARVNDGEPIRFILDTGATQSLLDRQVAANLGLHTHAGYSMTTGSGSIKTDFVSAEKFTIGDITLSNVAMAVAPLQGFAYVPDPKPGGLLGANILRRFLVTIDYPNRTVTLANPQKVTVPDGATVLDTKPALGSAGRNIDGELDGKKLTFLIDTGAAINNMSESQAKSILDCPLFPVGTIEGLDGQKVSIASARFNKLTVGKLSVDRPIFSIAPRGTQKLQPGIINAEQLAILGNPLWSRYKMTVDYRTQRIIIEESEDEREMDAVEKQIGKIRQRLYASEEPLPALNSLHELADQTEAKARPAAAALARVSYGSMIAALSAIKEDAAMLESAHKEFEHAQQLAEQSKNRYAQGRVLALRALSSISHDLPPNFADAKQYIERAEKFTNTDSNLALCLYFFYKRAQISQAKAKELLDQAVMLEPDNWMALWEEFALAAEDHREADRKLILQQLQHYYPDAKKVKEASKESPSSTTSGAASQSATGSEKP